MVRGRRNVPRKRRRGNLFIYSSELGAAAAVGALESDLLAEMISPSLFRIHTHTFIKLLTPEHSWLNTTLALRTAQIQNNYVTIKHVCISISAERCTEFAMRDAALFEL